MAERPDPAGAAEVLDAAERPGAADAAGAGHRPWPSDRFPPGHTLPGRPGTAGPVAGHAAAAGPHRARRRGPRLPVLAVGGAVAALALMTGTAYVMGGDDAVPAEGAETATLAHPDAPGLPASGEPLGATELFDASGSGVPGAEGTGPRVAFGLGGEPDFTPAGTLNTGELAAFRSQGWTCPELHELGFHLIWARAGVISGDEVLELRLTDGRHFATVLEQHASTRAPAAPPAPARAEVSPINVLTGHTAVADGFIPAKAGTPSAAPEPGNGFLWVNPAPPYRAIYQTVGGDIHVHFGPAGRAGGRRRCRADPGQQWHSRAGLAQRNSGTDRAWIEPNPGAPGTVRQGRAGHGRHTDFAKSSPARARG